MTRLRIHNLGKVIERIERGDKIVQKELEYGLDIIGMVVREKIQEYTPVDRGKLRDSIEARAEADRKGIKVIVGAYNIDPVIVASVASGTKPHWPPWGPGSALEGWAQRKGIPVFLVARAIARFGTIKRFGRPKGGAEMFKKGLADSHQFIRDRVELIKKRVLDDWRV